MSGQTVKTNREALDCYDPRVSIEEICTRFNFNLEKGLTTEHAQTTSSLYYGP